eukprot:PITA_19464
MAVENDKLRWGPKGNGDFYLKEARSIIEREEQPDTMPWTDKVWDSLQWPKIRTFLWLLMQKKTLTWENLLKKGFRGPSRCPMCLKEAETMNHLFNSCDWASQLWHWMEEILEAPGFIAWTIWKERNRRIFTEEVRNIEFAKDSITINIRQLIQAKCKADSNEKPMDQDLRILKRFQLEASSNQPTWGNRAQHSSQIHRWQHPPEGGLKLNFDGASRGNPGIAGIGGAIRNQDGDIIHIYCRALGECTNNEAEFVALEKGLKILRTIRRGNVIVEGDSSLAISAAKRLQAGTKASKATKHWRLAKATESIAEMIVEMRGIVFQSVRRKANGLGDFLANHRADNPNIITNSYWQEVECPILKVTCAQLVEKDTNQADPT